eukprot:6844970-Prymnesium_polylepis.1
MHPPARAPPRASYEYAARRAAHPLRHAPIALAAHQRRVRGTLRALWSGREAAAVPPPIRLTTAPLPKPALTASVCARAQLAAPESAAARRGRLVAAAHGLR